MTAIKLWIARDNFENLEGRKRTDAHLFFTKPFKHILHHGIWFEGDTSKPISKSYLKAFGIEIKPGQCFQVEIGSIVKVAK
jgi:hypothetical protein